MKWRKLLELCARSSPPVRTSRTSQPTRRRALFETLENRKLFAADLVEITTEELKVEPTFDDPEIMMMTFRSGEPDDVAAVDTAKADDVIYDTTAIDDVMSDGDLIFYSLGPTPEIETTSVEDISVAEDVNGDGEVTALDMLLVINSLNQFGSVPAGEANSPSSESMAVGDINRDGYVTPLDVLLLTNYFNRDGSLDTVEESSDAFAPSSATRIRNLAEQDASIDDAWVNQAAPLIENNTDDLRLAMVAASDPQPDEVGYEWQVP